MKGGGTTCRMHVRIAIIRLKSKEAGAQLNTISVTQSTSCGDGHIIDKATIGTAKIRDPKKIAIATNGRVLT